MTNAEVVGSAVALFILTMAALKWLLNHHMSEKKTWDLEREKRLDHRFTMLESSMKETNARASKMGEDMHALDKRLINESRTHEAFRESMDAFKLTMTQVIQANQKILNFLGSNPDEDQVIQISPTHWIVHRKKKKP